MVDRINTNFNLDNLTNKKIENSSKKDNIVFNLIDKVDNIQKDSQKKIESFVNGSSDNLAEVVLSMQKADIALRFTSAVANKAIESYRQIMRMQV